MTFHTLENLIKAILSYDAEASASLARKTLEEGIDPVETIDAITEAIRQVGDGFGKGELWLPELVGAATAMKAATPIIEEEITKAGKKRETLGTIVMGTVYGDIHDIGKNIVITMLMADGFAVHDVGINITANEFVEAVKQHKPDILALSALMTMTSNEQIKVIEDLKREGIRDQVKVMVGGGAITQEFADSIGADGYESSAPGAVGLARRLMGIE